MGHRDSQQAVAPRPKKLSSRETPQPSRSAHKAAIRVSISPFGGDCTALSPRSLGDSNRASLSIFPARVSGMAVTNVTEAGFMYAGRRWLK
jgi:hypothetical protein